MADNTAIEQFWLECQERLADDLPNGRREKLPEAWGFGDSANLADELAQLVRSGIKTATCSLFWEYEVDGDPLPQVGELSIILDGAGEPVALIQTTEVRILPMSQVEPSFAYEEGEGDRSWQSWHDAHWRYFSRICQKIGRQPDESMPLVCQRFRLLHKSSILGG